MFAPYQNRGSFGFDLGQKDFLSAEFIQDWAVWAIVAFARFDKTGQHHNDAPMLFHAGHDCLLVALGEDTNFSARSFRVAPKTKQLVDLFDRKAEGSGAPNKAQLMHVAFVEDPVAIRAPAGGAQQSYVLVVPDQFGWDPGKPSRVTNPHHHQNLQN